jgi:hypothetical protein
MAAVLADKQRHTDCAAGTTEAIGDSSLYFIDNSAFVAGLPACPFAALQTAGRIASADAAKTAVIIQNQQNLQ